MSSPISDPYAELRLSLPTNTLSECRRGGGILRTYGEGTSGRLRLEIEPAAAVSRSGSLTNGIFVAKVLPKLILFRLCLQTAGNDIFSCREQMILAL